LSVLAWQNAGTGIDALQSGVVGVELEIQGGVQGIGLRPWIVRTARGLGLRGRVRNLADGVRVQAFGSAEALAKLSECLETARLPGLSIERMGARRLVDPPAPPPDFQVETSHAPVGGAPSAATPLVSDLPVCETCLDETRDPSSRRYRHPFTHCAACGPRYTVARALPWDRERTALADFPLCRACADEYADPADRRFHAEATTCPRCGPRLVALAPGGAERAEGEAALGLACEVLRGEGSVALLGIGGFQLVCDATSERAVARLRRRKRRGAKPFAVMVDSLAEAGKHAVLDPAERALLTSLARPIVLAARRDDAGIARGVAPGPGGALLGLMLPTTPLHALLLDDVARPLVMTSGNRSGEPIVHRVCEAPLRLGGAVDLILAHDRAVERPCDDSVTRVAVGAPLLLRRARGFVPRPIRLARPLRRVVLAVGSQWSNVPCVAVGDRAWPGTHVGDLESPESVDLLARSAEELLAWLGVRPELVAHDLHPGYESTRLAGELSRCLPGVRAVAVQHHHAHLASLLGETRAEGPVLALVWDGTGLGYDGASWGGELLWGGSGAAQRIATLRPLRLPGGDRAVREVWRTALAALDDAFDGTPPLASLALFDALAPDAVERVRALLASGQACPPAHGVGRLFDAVAALVLARAQGSFQAELAIALEGAARGACGAAYPFAIDREGTPWQLDWRPTLRAVVADLLAGRPARGIAARFHGTLVDAGAALLRRAAALRPGTAFAITGGCFQNRILVEGIVRALPGQRILRHQKLPPGDGGLALGQALVADAMGDA
jgi:hydrogenase maturation protein HypF